MRDLNREVMNILSLCLKLCYGYIIVNDKISYRKPKKVKRGA